MNFIDVVFEPFLVAQVPIWVGGVGIVGPMVQVVPIDLFWDYAKLQQDVNYGDILAGWMLLNQT